MDRNILAGMFACSNMGQKVDLNDVESALRSPPSSAGESAIHFCAQYMENEHHEEVFNDEAVSWWDKLNGMTDEEITKMWPDMVALYKAAGQVLT